MQRWWDGQQWAAHTGGPASTGQPSGGGGGSRGPIIAVVVALILVLVAAATVVIVLLSGGGSGDDPEDAAEQYVRAQVEADYLTRCQIATAEAREGLFEYDDVDSCEEYVEAREADQAESDEIVEDQYGMSYADFVDDLELDFEIVEVDLDADETTAEVEIDTTVTYTGSNDDVRDDQFDGGDSDTETFVVHLEKEDDQWRVAGVD